MPGSKPHIAAVICFPNGEIEFYSKQYLHDGEGTYCAAGETNHLLNINNTRIALAVCADFAKPQHAQGAADSEAELYLVSALISPSGFILMLIFCLALLVTMHSQSSFVITYQKQVDGILAAKTVFGMLKEN